MEALTTTFLIPDWTSAGLTDGLYELVGGVIREVGSKHMVAWLKEGFNPVGRSFPPTEGLRL